MPQHRSVVRLARIAGYRVDADEDVRVTKHSLQPRGAGSEDAAINVKRDRSDRGDELVKVEVNFGRLVAVAEEGVDDLGARRLLWHVSYPRRPLVVSCLSAVVSMISAVRSLL